MSKLVVRDSRGEQTISLDGTVTIGRHPKCTVVLNDPMVSKRHAIIHKVRGRFVFEDSGSSNGSFHDGVRIYKHNFSDGDAITMGKVTLTFYGESDEDKFADMVNISQAFDATQVWDRVELDGYGHFMPERDVTDLNLLREDYEKLRLGHELLQHISMEQHLSKALDHVCNELIRVFAADRCAIMLAHPHTGELVPKAVQTVEESKDKLSISESVLNEVRETKSAVLLTDASQDERFSHASSLVMQGIRSVMCAPIMYEGQFFGVVHLDSIRGAVSFTRKDLQVLSGIVHYIAMVIANNRLLRKVEREAMAKAQFERLLSPSVAEQVLSGKVKLEKGGELRDVTILFADIRNFTSMARRTEATQVVAMLNRYFEMVVDIVFKHGGTVDKYIGDEIMVLFGAPVQLEHAADHAVACGLEMQAAMEQFNRDRNEAGEEKIEIGIGINSGEVVVGSIGSSRTMQYTCIGDAVNVASRLTGRAAAGEVIVSEHTVQRLAGNVEYELLPPMALKGIEGTFNTYRIKGLLLDTLENDPFDISKDI